jgi:acyl carrier protein
MCRKLKELKRIEAMGSKILLYSADVADLGKMEEIINGLRKTYGRIHGVIHSAGASEYGFLAAKDEKKLAGVLSSKVAGTWILDHLTKQDQPDFFILFSSIASVAGYPGLGDYMAANSFLDSYAAYRNRMGRKTLTINWTTWKETGMAVEQGVNFDGEFKAITDAEALAAFDKVFGKQSGRILIGELNFLSHAIQRRGAFPFELSEKIKENAVKFYEHVRILNSSKDKNPSGEHKSVTLKGREAGESYTGTEVMLAQVWCELLGLQEISINDNFFDLGGNSLIAVKVEAEMEKSSVPVEYSDLDEYPTIRELAQFIESKKSEVLANGA